MKIIKNNLNQIHVQTKNQRYYMSINFLKKDGIDVFENPIEKNNLFLLVEKSKGQIIGILECEEVCRSIKILATFGTTKNLMKDIIFN